MPSVFSLLGSCSGSRRGSDAGREAPQCERRTWNPRPEHEHETEKDRTEKGERLTSYSTQVNLGVEERDVCRSDVDQPCVIHVSSQDEPVSVVVSVYLHPVADAKTTYQGAFFAEFMATTAITSYERQVDVAIEPGRKPTGLTASGHVTATPGQYFFKMALLAEVPMHTDPHQFEQSIPVEVIAS